MWSMVRVLRKTERSVTPTDRARWETELLAGDLEQDKKTRATKDNEVRKARKR